MSSEKPAKVLLVEDTEDNRFMMRRLLEMTGYEVVEARNGEEAVKIAQTELPDWAAMREFWLSVTWQPTNSRPNPDVAIIGARMKASFPEASGVLTLLCALREAPL